nr:hypothetical protein Hi04_10k_c2441B_00026 [uncultured bacterium]
MQRPTRKRARFRAGLVATIAAGATACSALVPDLPAPPDAAMEDGPPESAPGADATNEDAGWDAPIGTNDASDGGSPGADATSGAPTFVQSNSFASGPTASGGGTLSATFAGPQTAGDLIVAIVIVWSGAVSQTPVDTKGNQYHLAKHQLSNGANAGDIYIWYAWNCAAATANSNTVTVSVPSNTYQDLIIEECTKVQSAADPLDVTGGANGATGAPSCTASPIVAGVAVAGSISDNGQKDAGGGWKLRVDTTDGELAIDQVVSSPGTITPNTTPADDGWTIAVAVFKAQ